MAKTGITFNIQKELANIAKNKALLDWTYLSRIDDENFTEIVKHLYPNDAARAKLLNPWSYIGNIVWDKFKNFVWEAKTDFTELDFDLMVESILTRWQILLKYTNSAWKWSLKAVRWETYWQDGWIEKIAKLYPVYSEKDLLGFPTYYLYVQSYNWNELKNDLYKVNTIDNLSDWEPVPLSSVYELSNLPPYQVIENLPRLVEVVDVWDRPIMDTIRTLVYSIDRKLAEAEKHFNDYSEQFKIFQNIEIPKSAFVTLSDKTRVINWDKLWKIVRTQEDFSNWDIKIIKNGNELLEQALEHVDKQISLIAAITDIPLEYFGFQTVRDSGAWKEVWNAHLFKRIQKYRDKIETALNRCFDFLWTFTEVDKKIIWPPIIRMSENDILNKQILMVQNNLTSLKRAIMEVHNTDEQQADELIEEIKKDQSNWLLVSLKASNQNADAMAKQNAVLNK